MILEVNKRFFARVPGEVYPRGPFRSRTQAEQALANVAAKAERAASDPGIRRSVPKSEPIEPRVIVGPRMVGHGMKALPRRERLARAVKARNAHKVEMRRAKPGRAKRADTAAPAQGDTGA